MRAELRRRRNESVVALLCLALAGLASKASAQAKPPLAPEVAQILGQPEAKGAALDADVVAVLGQPQEAKPSEATVAVRSADVASKLRCPVCQGVSIADSPSGMATNMRGQVRELVAKGYSEEQIMSYFERSYGEFVRLEPPLRGLNVMLWALPVLVLVGGGVFVLWKARQPVSAAAPVDPQPNAAGSSASEVDPALAKYLERIRRDSGTSS